MMNPRRFEIYFVPSCLLKKYWHIALWNPLKRTICYFKYEEVEGKKSKTRTHREHICVDNFDFDLVWMNGYGTRDNMVDRIFDIVGDYHLPRKDAEGFLILYTKEEAREYTPEEFLFSYNASYYDSNKFGYIQEVIQKVRKKMLPECKLTVDRWVKRDFDYYEAYRVKLFHQRVYKPIKKSWREFETRPDIHFNLVDTIDLTVLTTLSYWVQLMQDYEDAMNEAKLESYREPLENIKEFDKEGENENE